MPYVITTKEPCRACRGTGDWLDAATGTGPCDECDGAALLESKRAVATLEEARVEVGQIQVDHAVHWKAAANAASRRVSESGGTVGPLPDGTVIEVVGGERADTEMRLACPLIFTSDWLSMSVGERCAAFNAKYSTPQEGERT